MKLRPVTTEDQSEIGYPTLCPVRHHRRGALRRLGLTAALCLGLGCSPTHTAVTPPALTQTNTTASSTSPRQTSQPGSSQYDDRDRDTIVEAHDLCPDEPEDLDDFQDEDGCPDEDNDGDSIPDADDQCPLHAEIWNGFQDEDGCPDRPAGVVIAAAPVRFMDVIHFPSGSSNVPQSAGPILDAVAATIRDNPQLLLIEVQAHSDERGRDPDNLRITRQRAENIRQYLIDQGVEPSRVRAAGYGERCPVDDGHNEEAWQRNRRVEFRIIRSEGGESDQEPAPCDAARDLNGH